MKKSAYWGNHVKRWRGSDLTQSEYCRREKISLTSFSNWRKRLLEDIPQEQFVELAPSSQSEKMELILKSGLRLALPMSISSARLQELAKCLS